MTRRASHVDVHGYIRGTTWFLAILAIALAAVDIALLVWALTRPNA